VAQVPVGLCEEARRVLRDLLQLGLLLAQRALGFVALRGFRLQQLLPLSRELRRVLRAPSSFVAGVTERDREPPRHQEQDERDQVAAASDAERVQRRDEEEVDAETTE